MCNAKIRNRILTHVGRPSEMQTGLQACKLTEETKKNLQ